jgi:hypothetical protein
MIAGPGCGDFPGLNPRKGEIAGVMFKIKKNLSFYFDNLRHVAQLITLIVLL